MGPLRIDILGDFLFAGRGYEKSVLPDDCGGVCVSFLGLWSTSSSHWGGGGFGAGGGLYGHWCCPWTGGSGTEHYRRGDEHRFCGDRCGDPYDDESRREGA